VTEETQLDLWELDLGAVLPRPVSWPWTGPTQAEFTKVPGRADAAQTLVGEAQRNREPERSLPPTDAACTAGATRGLGPPARAIGEKGRPITRASRSKRRPQASR